MDELTRQRRVTTRLLGALLSLVTLSLLFGIYWTLVLRPAQGRAMATAPVMPQATGTAPLDLGPSHAATRLSAATVSSVTMTAAVSASPSLPLSAPMVRQSSERAPRAGRPAAAKTAAHAPVEVMPVAAPPPPAIEVGYLNLDTTPWSTVSLGGKVLGQTPLVGATLPAGTHVLVLTNPELGLKTTYQITIAAGRTTARRVGLDP